MADRITGSMDPGRNIYNVVPGPGALNPRPKALWVNEACSLTLVGDDGIAETVVLAGPGPVPMSPVKVTASTAQAGMIKAIWG